MLRRNWPSNQGVMHSCLPTEVFCHFALIMCFVGMICFTFDSKIIYGEAHTAFDGTVARFPSPRVPSGAAPLPSGLRSFLFYPCLESVIGLLIQGNAGKQ